MVITEAYIDESYDDNPPPILCVAGYVFREAHAREFENEWGGFLRAKGLPYFHMSECTHSSGVFTGRSDNLEIAKKLIELTRNLSGFGFAATVNEEDYNRILRPLGMPSPYGFVLQMCIQMVALWKRANDAEGATKFFFEEGHKHAGDAQNFLNWTFGTEKQINKYGFSGDAFVPKETMGLHPADFLAWHERLEIKRQSEAKRRPPRKDLEAMLRPSDWIRHFVLEDLQQIKDGIEKTSYLVPGCDGAGSTRIFV